MLTHTLIPAARQLLYFRGTTLISLGGLVIGLTVFLFATLIVAYERDHDRIFSQLERIYTVGSVFNPDAGGPILEYPNARLAYAPLLRQSIMEADEIARSIHREHIVSVNGQMVWYGIRFNDPGFLNIFAFDYLQGDATALDQVDGLILTRSTAQALFGRVMVQGESVQIDTALRLIVTAVIEDVPPDSHFNSSWLPNSKLTMMASVDALIALGDFDRAGEWDSLNPADFTYVLLPESRDRDWLQEQVDQVMRRHTPEQEFAYINALSVRPLDGANTLVWDALGFPVLQSVSLLGLLVLLAAGINYTNLSTAQGFSRTREVGLRKTFGASRLQLYAQFLMEALILTSVSALVSLALIELLVPFYNHWTGKGVQVDYVELLPLLCAATVISALVSSAYPSWLISREEPIDSLRGRFLKSVSGQHFRTLMIVAQFSISIFILSLVLIIHFQNQLFDSLSSAYPRDEIRVLERLDLPAVLDRQLELRDALRTIEGVDSVSLSGGIPFLQTGGYRNVTLPHQSADAAFELRLVASDPQFLSLYDIALTSGQLGSDDLSNDESTPLILNLNAVAELGLDPDQDILGQTVIAHGAIAQNDTDQPRTERFHIAGLVDDRYFLGVHMNQLPVGFAVFPDQYSFASIRLDAQRSTEIEADIRAVWSQVVPGQPIWMQPLDHYFSRFFRIAETISIMMVLFAGLAMSLALIGLFGLSAFMAQRRRREIGLRKVMGASTGQVVRLLVRQFSRPVIIAMLITFPLAWWASQIYLGFYAERITMVVPIISLACLIALIAAWSVVAIQALRIARSSPIVALRTQ